VAPVVRPRTAPFLVVVITVQHALQIQLVLHWASKAIAAPLRRAPTSSVAEAQGQPLLLHLLHHRQQASVISVELVHVQRASLAFPSRLGLVLLVGLSRQMGAPVCQTARMMVVGTALSSYDS